ncbi:hypothetical protein NPIL_481911 [Nephila pilipes]|uniref:Uncharacterized protein n=1 Tax=Nephila pilipes TaxID=299642 RepID=A0A8X6PC51_NEPPI|nr:hypothetical protein NPIL_481911 [Nephila pilipes]
MQELEELGFCLRACHAPRKLQLRYRLVSFQNPTPTEIFSSSPDYILKELGWAPRKVRPQCYRCLEVFFPGNNYCTETLNAVGVRNPLSTRDCQRHQLFSTYMQICQDTSNYYPIRPLNHQKEKNLPQDITTKLNHLKGKNESQGCMK